MAYKCSLSIIAMLSLLLALATTFVPTSAQAALPSSIVASSQLAVSPAVTLTAGPAVVTFTTTVNNAVPLTQSITLTATSPVSYSTSISYSASSGGANWLAVSPITSTVISGTSLPVTLTATVGKLVAGNYSATVNFVDNSNPADSAAVTVNLVVNQAGPPYVYNLPFLANQYTAPGQVITGSFTSYLAFQNVGSGAASVSLQYFDASGNTLTTPSGTCTSVAQYGECLAPSPFVTGTRGTGVIT